MTPFWPVGHARGVGIEGALGKVSLFTRKWTSGSAFPSYHSMLFHFWVSRWATLHPSCFPKDKSLKIQLMLRTAEQSLGGPWTGGITELLDVWTFPSMKFKPVWADVFCLMKLKSFWQVLLLMEPLMAIIFILEFFPGIPPMNVQEAAENEALHFCVHWPASSNTQIYSASDDAVPAGWHVKAAQECSPWGQHLSGKTIHGGFPHRGFWKEKYLGECLASNRFPDGVFPGHLVSVTVLTHTVSCVHGCHFVSSLELLGARTLPLTCVLGM